ncbi:MAG: 23S rRNA (adenine(2503)-C(2))-methyltransferase RlmN [Treponema sp.]|jgi:23S rRNA (adenine2503-C2)-methyltransferase|nr:23S rRNA (adenine(2503)-C(2))-methyltransferase RlmN [Treponema sp.]
MHQQIPLVGLPLHELTTLLHPLPRFRSVQIYKWIARGVLDYDQMTDLPLAVREKLKERFPLCSAKQISRHDDRHAVKIVLALEDGVKIESVLLSDGKERLTACLSTQAGCPAGCVFCKTGQMGFIRNLNSAEIIEQFLFLRTAALRTIAHEKKMREIENIVIMGMGEPLLNPAHLRKAIAVIIDPEGMNFSKRRITISTCGIYDGIIDIAENGPLVRLALSLTTADELLRQKLMPVTATQPLKKIKEALIHFQHKGGGRITLEAALLGGINTRREDAASIAEFAKGIDAVVNLIPWNPVAGLEFEGKPLREPDKKETEDFITMLESLGLKVTRRLGKGRKVMGACGQLG